MPMFRTFGLIFIGILPVCAHGQSHRDMRQGETFFEKQAFAKAETAYKKAGGPSALYNAGVAAYRQGKFEDAETLFKNAAQTNSESLARANALYNLANAQVQLGRLEPAIESYEKCLRLFPNTSDAKKNLQIAKKLLKEQQEPPPPAHQPPPPPPPVERPQHNYLDQPDPNRHKSAQAGPYTEAAARQLLQGSVSQQETENALDYRGLAPATGPSKVKKDW